MIHSYVANNNLSNFSHRLITERHVSHIDFFLMIIIRYYFPSDLRIPLNLRVHVRVRVRVCVCGIKIALLITQFCSHVLILRSLQ